MINLDFLEGRHISQLDGYITPETQSIAIEVLFWTICYTLFVQCFSRALRCVYRQTNIWNYAKKREGIFLGNGRDDAVLLTCLGVHHGCAAYLMYIGLMNDDPDLWCHGFLLEAGFEVADYAAIIFGIFPYASYDGFRADVKPILMAHHVPGIVLSFFVMNSGLYQNVHMQKICLALLGGAFFSCIATVYIYSLNPDKQMTQAAVAFNLAAVFFLWCRWWVYPIESFALLEEVRAHHELSNGIILYVLYAAGILMALFNLGIAADVLPKCIRYTKRAFDGVTPIDINDISSSRDSILRRRRSSVMKVVEAVNPIRRYSLITVMGMNAIEDIVNTSKNNDDDDLDPDDLKNLNKTLSSMSSKKDS